MNRNKMFILAGVLSASLFVAGCGNNSNNTSPENEHETITYSVPSFSANNVGTVLLSSQPMTDNIAETASITAINKTGASSKLAREAKEVVYDHSRDLAPALREAAAPRLSARKANVNAKALAKTNTIYTDLAEGETTQVYVYKNASTPTLITVQKMHSNNDTTGTIVFAEVKNGTPVMTKSEALEMDEVFDGVNPYDIDDMSIGERVRSTFGSEWRNNGGLDGTTKVVMMMLSESTLGSGMYGYFNEEDAYTDDETQYSNEGEILYLNADVSDYNRWSTVAHEFQHMCDFNQKACHDGAFDGELEWATINEGKSVLSEDLCGYDLYSQGGGNEFIYSSASSFLASPDDYRFAHFNNASGDYGKGYLFMKYMYDEYGEKAITSIATSKDVGIKNIAKVANKEFIDVFHNFGLTLYMDPLENSPKEYRFKTIALDNMYTIRDKRDNAKEVVLGKVSPYQMELNDSVEELIDPGVLVYCQYTNGNGDPLELIIDKAKSARLNLILESSPSVYDSMK